MATMPFQRVPPNLKTDDPLSPGSAYSRLSLVSDITMTDPNNEYGGEEDEEHSLMYSEDGQHSSSRLDSESDDPAGQTLKSHKHLQQSMKRNERNNNLHHAKSSFRPNTRIEDDYRLVNFIVDSDDRSDCLKEEEPPSRSRIHSKQRQSHASGKPQTRVNNSGKKERGRKHRQHRPKIQEQAGASWMTQLAYSFRTPSPRRDKHHRVQSSSLQEYPHYPSSRDVPFSEESPLLEAHRVKSLTLADASPEDVESKSPQAYVYIAAAFLRDFESNRPPAFAAKRLEDITGFQVRLYQIKYGSLVYSAILVLAAISLFLSCFLEGFANPHHHRVILTLFNAFGVVAYAVDLWITYNLRGGMDTRRNRRWREQKEKKLVNGLDHVVRRSRSENFVQPLILFGIMLVIENSARLIVTPGENLVLFSSLFKPLMLYYVSSRARDAMDVLGRVARGVSRALLMQMFLILMFAAVAVSLFSDYEEFRQLGTAWLSLFELSTTVVNPGLWMPIYEHAKPPALFFIVFIVVCVFYMHCLILAVVFQKYINAASDLRSRSADDREDSMKLAFLSLRLYQNHLSLVTSEGTVSMFLVRETLKILRPHYNAMKINALVEIIGPSSQDCIDYETFRTRIRQALNASIRTTRNASPVAMVTELVAVVVAIVNFVYVLLVSSVYSSAWFDPIQEYIAIAITIVAGGELLVRFNPFRIRDFTPLTRLNATFDGIAVVAALTSIYGMGLFLLERPSASHYILIGRVIDMMRIMRFFQAFRVIVRRSSDVLPALLGPSILVLTTVHIFVYAGMAIWGGSTVIGAYELNQIEPYYELNNFNSYQEGLVTMFQLLVVNDWSLIAQVFLAGPQNSNPLVVYPFFVIANLVGVSVMMNVLVAFFVEAFVTKFNDDTDAPAEATATVHKDPSQSSSFERNLLEAKPAQRRPDSNGSDHDADSEGSSESELFEFDVYEREGFNKAMQTVVGSDDQGNLGKLICGYLEVFESLSPGRDTVGWLICDQQTLDRFGNRRFQTKAIGFLDESDLQDVVSNMHAELLALATRASFQDNSLIRRFPNQRNPSTSLEISASLLRLHPALSLFVCRHVPEAIAVKQKV